MAITGASEEVVAALWRGSDRARDPDPDVAAAADRFLQFIIAEDAELRTEPSPSASPSVDHRGLTPMAAMVLRELLDAPTVDVLSVTTPASAEALRELLAWGLVEYIDDHHLPSELVLDAFEAHEWNDIRAMRQRHAAERRA